MILPALCLSSQLPAGDSDFLRKHYHIVNNDQKAEGTWSLSLVDGCYVLQNECDQLRLAIDFRRDNYRHRNRFIGQEKLVKAIRIKGRLPKTLIDATPGVLKDSFMLANRGIAITAIERQALIYVMVKRALSHVQNSIPYPIDYRFGDAIDDLSKYHSDIIYLDPMYPPSQKSAQVKKDMQVLQRLVGSDEDASELLHSARHRAARVVVKRPSGSKPLGNITPDFVARTATTRFDVYLPRC